MLSIQRRLPRMLKKSNDRTNVICRNCTYNQIIPRYFEKYIEIICTNSENPSGCIQSMIVPDIQRQIDVLKGFDMLVQRYDIVDASAFLQSSIMKLLIEKDDDTLMRVIDLLNSYNVVTHMLQETLT